MMSRSSRGGDSISFPRSVGVGCAKGSSLLHFLLSGRVFPGFAEPLPPLSGHGEGVVAGVVAPAGLLSRHERTCMLWESSRHGRRVPA